MSNQSTIIGSQLSCDREKELKAFDERKSGVKGLVDEGATTIPSIFIRPLEDRLKEHGICHDENINVPIIDLAHFNERNGKSEEILKEIREASAEWGFFMVVNHGIPKEVLDSMLQGVKMFHEQDVEVKQKFFTRDMTKSVIYNTNRDFNNAKFVKWRDSLNVHTVYSGELNAEELPPICREAILDYVNHVIKLGDKLLELLSVALGLESDHLRKMECTKGWNLTGHYYPPCPEPELTLGATKHSDAFFLTILLQDHVGGLQVLHNNQWVNVEPIPGALIVNIGDVLRMISNDKLKSGPHRVVAKKVGPRISVAFFFTGLISSGQIYGPIKELLSVEDEARYKEFTLRDFFKSYFSLPSDQPKSEYFKIK